MVFANEEHEKFYFEKLEQARYQDCYHKALIYILGIVRVRQAVGEPNKIYVFIPKTEGSCHE